MDRINKDGPIEFDKFIRMHELKTLLTSTDYVVIKIAEGSATADEYADVIAQRQTWRAEINELESTELKEG